MTAAARPAVRPLPAGSPLRRPMRRFLAISGITLFATMLVSVFLMPLAYMAATAFKSETQTSTPGAPLWPAKPETFTYRGEEYPVFRVPTEDGLQSWALVEPHREDAVFIDPDDPGAGPITWVGRWRTLEQSWSFSLDWSSFTRAWEILNFPRMFFNTFAIAGLSTVGAVLSAVCVAYGFSRFRFPGRNGLFLLMLATIILPFQVTLIPTYAVYFALGWVGTWLPLIIPHFFANAYNVFLLRQYFLTIPRDLDEAAMIDGAGPFRILRSVIIPQAMPAIVAVTLFHFFWAWNEYFLPLVYLQGNPDLQPLSVGLGRFNSLYSGEPTVIQAAALMAMALPVVVFFLAQRAFMRGVVFGGVEK
ncbi:MAG TPA: carbohydrate ABC transporter permease [candidate division Zixibacteria bacterium]|nr:carbohydrate ABC transporter permease [candidate division Zixibacteria bacterium]